jgi:hypothetical protein
MVDRGEVRDYADLARLGYVTRAAASGRFALNPRGGCIPEQVM